VVLIVVGRIALESSTEVLSLDVTPSTVWVDLRRGGRVGAVRDRETGPMR
jgi:hypothetical protein